ncbi:SurA N-terminal domain-containing protein [Paenibacillus sp. HB172176]|uniref:SurA N-terminal domain-containing protein n=1 Tax=Paenibacillus sp. HB172176 TaxID=2493690 RepID=UPI001439C4A0|nr:SurA N-terminal domain-containing protein [Paenibacillus sp. HB172176]
MRLRWRWVLGPSVAALLLAGAAGYPAITGYASEPAVVAEVNGSSIASAEFEKELRRQRASVIDYFRQTYGLEYDKTFWETSVNGENPLELVKQRALDQLVARKVELALAEREGLIEGSSYSDLLRELKEENKRRQLAVEENQAIYGPVRLDEDAFTPYYMSNLRNALKEKLSDAELQLSEEELEQRVEQAEAVMSGALDEIAFQKLSVSYRDGQEGNEGAKQSKQDAEKQLKAMKRLAEERLFAIKQLLEDGMEPAEAIKQEGIEGDELEIRYTEEKFGEGTAGMYFKSQPALFAMLEGDLEEGELSPVFEEAATGEFVLVKIIGRKEGEAESSGELEQATRNSYRDEAYLAYLKRLIDNAHVEIVEDSWKSIKL